MKCVVRYCLKYRSNEDINPKLYDLYTAKGIKLGLNEYDAQVYSLEKLRENHAIDFEEVL